MQITIGKILGLLVGIGYSAMMVVGAIASSKSPAEAAILSCEQCVIVFIPVALIWFPEQIGAATGYIGHSVVDTETPPFLVSMMGWVFLIGMPLLYFLLQPTK